MILNILFPYYEFPHKELNFNSVQYIPSKPCKYKFNNLKFPLCNNFTCSLLSYGKIVTSSHNLISLGNTLLSTYLSM